MSIIFLYLQITDTMIETKAIKLGSKPKKKDGIDGIPEKKPEHPTH